MSATEIILNSDLHVIQANLRSNH